MFSILLYSGKKRWYLFEQDRQTDRRIDWDEMGFRICLCYKGSHAYAGGGGNPAISAALHFFFFFLRGWIKAVITTLQSSDHYTDFFVASGVRPCIFEKKYFDSGPRNFKLFYNSSMKSFFMQRYHLMCERNLT